MTRSQKRSRSGYYKNWYSENREVKKDYTRFYFRRVRLATLELMGGKCAKCGFADKRALQVDHIDGGGTKDRKTITKVYFKIVMESILKQENKYQLLCANCNWIKRFENKENKK